MTTDSMRNNVFAFALRLEAFLIDNLDPPESSRTVTVTFCHRGDKLVVEYSRRPAEPVYRIIHVKYLTVIHDDGVEEEEEWETTFFPEGGLATACSALQTRDGFEWTTEGSLPMLHFDHVSVKCSRAFSAVEVANVNAYVNAYVNA